MAVSWRRRRRRSSRGRPRLPPLPPQRRQPRSQRTWQCPAATLPALTTPSAPRSTSQGTGHLHRLGAIEMRHRRRPAAPLALVVSPGRTPARPSRLSRLDTRRGDLTRDRRGLDVEHQNLTAHRPTSPSANVPATATHAATPYTSYHSRGVTTPPPFLI